MATSTPITGDQADLECMKAHPYFRYSHKGGVDVDVLSFPGTRL
ncbi:MAG TPA: hypothetical protein QGI40_01310 [Nitrospinaceae bacterium]|nr:hypothetical protein [Nitrospinaceae bacterium]HJN99841.1 hypothetical protein [Nitrospinaceae bacterium]